MINRLPLRLLRRHVSHRTQDSPLSRGRLRRKLAYILLGKFLFQLRQVKVEDLQSALLTRAETHAEAVMPGFTHLQTAQPITFGHHMLAWNEMLERDHGRLLDCRARMNQSPLGAAALAGTTYGAPTRGEVELAERVLCRYPFAGQVRFTIVDPVGLGESFAGFMHAGDYLESLVGGRIWTEAPQIQQQLEELTGLESRVTILGHLQRGGTPSAADRLLATRLGTACASLIHDGVSGVMVAARGETAIPVPLSEVAGKKKLVPDNHPWVESARLVGVSFGD